MILCRDSVGTGFLLSSDISGVDRTYLVTNKHVISKVDSIRHSVKSIEIELQTKTTTDSTKSSRQNYSFPLVNGTRQLWREHANEEVDVWFLDVTDTFIRIAQMENKPIDEEFVATDSVVTAEYIRPPVEVLAVGYPVSTYRGFFPLVREGILATHIQHPLFRIDGRNEIPLAFYIDGAVIPGSSGSPIVVKPSTEKFIDGQWMIGPARTSYLLGIVAAVPLSTVPYTNLGIAFNYKAIRETLSLFRN